MEQIFEILKALLFGVVEGITEWLPVSSTGHMILLNEFVKLNVSKEFWDMFLVVIQLGAILAVVLICDSTFWSSRKLLSLVLLILPSELMICCTNFFIKNNVSAQNCEPS